MTVAHVKWNKGSEKPEVIDIETGEVLTTVHVKAFLFEPNEPIKVKLVSVLAGGGWSEATARMELVR